MKDLLVGLYYEQESRRLKNSMAENIIYGWQEDGATGSLDFVGDLDDLRILKIGFNAKEE